MLIPRIAQPFDVELALPGSKSIALRQLAISALCEGETILTGVPICDDALAMIDCLRTLGADIILDDTRTIIRGPIDYASDVALDARMSGASTRFLIAIAALRDGRTNIDGHASLRVRTNAPLLDVLRRHQVSVEAPDHGGLPLRIQGPLREASTLEIDGSLSSQYISALLMIGPCLGGTKLKITGELVSRPYLDITTHEMHKRGVDVTWASDTEIIVPGARYESGDSVVEGDATAASYFSALATLHESSVTLTNLGTQSVQGDYGFFEIMAELGAKISATPETTRVTGPASMRALPRIDMLKMPDVALTLITLAPLLPEPLRIDGLSTLHHKECDRLECSARELRAMGVDVKTDHEWIHIAPSAPRDLTEHTLSTYHDHRMAMAFSLLGSVSGRLSVDDANVVDKTYPNYWLDYARLVG